MDKVTKAKIFELISKNKIELGSTHLKLCVPVINRISQKMAVGIKFPGIKVANNLICDGHHRYIASLLTEFPLERIPGIITSATINIPWLSVLFVEEDWDTLAKIQMLNEQDAAFNNISISEITDLQK